MLQHISQKKSCISQPSVKKYFFKDLQQESSHLIHQLKEQYPVSTAAYTHAIVPEPENKNLILFFDKFFLNRIQI
jgi:hypothetical protein